MRLGYTQTSAFNQRSSPSGRSHPQPVVRSTGPHHQHSSLLRTAAVAQGHARFQSAFVPRASASEFLGGGGEECATLYAEEPSGRGVSERHATTPTPLDLLNTPHEANLEQTMGEPGTSGSSHHPQHHPLPLLVRVFRHWSTAVLAATVVAAVAVVEVLGLTGYSAPYATLLDYVRSQLDAGYAVIEPNLTLEVHTQPPTTPCLHNLTPCRHMHALRLAAIDNSPVHSPCLFFR